MQAPEGTKAAVSPPPTAPPPAPPAATPQIRPKPSLWRRLRRWWLKRRLSRALTLLESLGLAAYRPQIINAAASGLRMFAQYVRSAKRDFRNAAVARERSLIAAEKVEKVILSALFRLDDDRADEERQTLMAQLVALESDRDVWRRSAEEQAREVVRLQKVLKKEEPDTPRVDRDGCFFLADGTCIGCPHCPHAPLTLNKESADR